MRAGALRGRVSIESPVEARDAAGGYINTWHVEGVRRCQRLAGTSKAVSALAQQYSQLSDVFVLRYEFDILHSWRLVYNGDVYRIVAVENVQDRNQETRIVTEREDSGTAVYGN